MNVYKFYYFIVFFIQILDLQPQTQYACSFSFLNCWEIVGLNLQFTASIHLNGMVLLFFFVDNKYCNC